MDNILCGGFAGGFVVTSGQNFHLPLYTASNEHHGFLAFTDVHSEYVLP